MKKRFLKNYETFKEESTNENTHYNYGFNTFQTISEEEESSKKTEEDYETTKESEESTKECDCDKGEECVCEKSTTEEEDNSKDESEEENEVVVDTDTDTDKTDNEVDASDSVDNNNGLQDITNSFNPLESTAREFSVAKIMTKNGAKIMMCYTCDAEDLSTLADNIDFQSACKMVETECEKSGLEKFDNANDVNLGGIPSFMMDKKTTDNESTSYRP